MIEKISIEQMIANAIIWIEALKSGKYQKGVGVLGIENEGEWSYCCLGVGCKALNIDEDFAKGYSSKFAYEVGLKTEMGYFDFFSNCLTSCNDDTYIDDKDFTNMVRVILENIDDLFIDPVAEGLKKHYDVKDN